MERFECQVSVENADRCDCLCCMCSSLQVNQISAETIVNWSNATFVKPHEYVHHSLCSALTWWPQKRWRRDKSINICFVSLIKPENEASFSADCRSEVRGERKHRYSLRRHWEGGQCFQGLSDATEATNFHQQQSFLWGNKSEKEYLLLA